MGQAQSVEEALAKVNRRDFLPLEFKNAPEDVAVPFGEGQTVPTAAITALLIELAELDPKDIVLEIGTGSGYQAAVIAELVDELHSVEIRPLAQDVAALLPKNVFIYQRDATCDVPVPSPAFYYDKIIVTCATPYFLARWASVLREGGIAVVPMDTGEICKYIKHHGTMEDMGPFAYADFVQLQSTRAVAPERAHCE